MSRAVAPWSRRACGWATSVVMGTGVVRRATRCRRRLSGALYRRAYLGGLLPLITLGWGTTWADAIAIGITIGATYSRSAPCGAPLWGGRVATLRRCTSA